MKTKNIATLIVISLAGLSIAACSTAEEPPDLSTRTNKGEDNAYVWRTGSDSLYVRSSASRSGEVLARLGNGTKLAIGCQTNGENVLGTAIWDYLPKYGGYVSDYFVYTGYDNFAPTIPRCDDDEQPKPAEETPKPSAPNETKPTSSMAQAAIAEARKYLGYIEGAGDCNQFSTWLGRNCEQWCSDFVNWVWMQAGFNVANITAYSGSIAEYGKQRATYKSGAWAENVAPGDAVLWGDGAFSDHVGMVTEVDADGTLTVIHGNYHACNGGQGCVYETKMSRSSTNAARGMPIYAYVSPVPK